VRFTTRGEKTGIVPWILGGIVVLVCLSVFALVGASNSTASAAKQSTDTGMSTPQPYPGPRAPNAQTTPGAPPGVAAITPHLNVSANAATIARAPTGTTPSLLPTFNANDATAYVTANPGPYPTSGSTAIRSVTFLTQEQVLQMLQTVDTNIPSTFGQPVGTPFCVVFLSGTFSLSHQPGATVSSQTWPYAFVVLNGVTGNFMGMGLLSILPTIPASTITP
jgi:hypothetical protein